jgi:hypothetical protein
MTCNLNRTAWIAASTLLVSGCQPRQQAPIETGRGTANVNVNPTTQMLRQEPCAVKSPDGRRVAYFEADQGPRPHLVVKNADGSHPVRYEAGPLPSDIGPFKGESQFQELAWSPNGKTLAFIDHRNYFRASAEWSDHLCLLYLPDGRFRGVDIRAWILGNLKWSRDSRHILLKAAQNDFSPKGEKTERSERWRVEATTGKAKKL